MLSNHTALEPDLYLLREPYRMNTHSYLPGMWYMTRGVAPLSLQNINIWAMLISSKYQSYSYLPLPKVLALTDAPPIKLNVDTDYMPFYFSVDM